MAVKYEPENLAHYYYLSDLKEEILHSNLKNKIYEIIKRRNSTKKNIAYGNFLLSRYELKAKNYKKEFNHLLKGHHYYFESRSKQFKTQVKYWLNVLPNIKELVNLNKSSKNIKKNNNKINPIFIIGVPRCGSTLVEKVIISGAKYIPVGEETEILNFFVKQKIQQKQLLKSDIENFQKKIIKKYKQKGLIQETSDYTFTDKSLDNFFYISLIKEIFPYAKVINCKRDALSCIMSILKNNLTGLAWTHNLEHIFRYLNIYYQMIENFKKIHPNFIYELQYEKFVKDPEIESKKLLKFCNLPWDKKCLQFFKRKDLISQTASNIQIRKAIYRDAIKKYLPYKKFLTSIGDENKSLIIVPGTRYDILTSLYSGNLRVTIVLGTRYESLSSIGDGNRCLNIVPGTRYKILTPLWSGNKRLNIVLATRYEFLSSIGDGNSCLNIVQ